MIDSNDPKNMLSILNAYLLGADFKGMSDQDQESRLSLLKMICEILNSVKETYIV